MRTICSLSARTDARPSAGGSRCCRSSASFAATSRDPAGRTTRQPARFAVTRCPRGSPSPRELPEPIFTPATKATTGHDENIDREQAAELVGAERLAEVERVSIALYRHAAEHARQRGIMIADTKFEFGLGDDGQLVLGDEALTPDSSRFWPADEYAPGGSQPSFDKQFVRDYCETLGWDKTPPGPGASRRCRRGHTGTLRGGVRAADGHRVRRLPRRPGDGAAMKATVLVRPKDGILDPQGQAVESSLRQLGFAVGEARVGRVVDLEVESNDAARCPRGSGARCASNCSRTL